MADYSVIELDISEKQLTHLPDDINKYTNLQKLDCRSNRLTSLDNLPLNLQTLNCSSNYLTSLDNLPLNLKELKCNNNPFIYNFEPTLENIKNYNSTRIKTF